MAARINIKNMDYFKFKKLVIDGSRDDYDQCSKEIKALCDIVQTLRFRDEEFDIVSDIDRFQEICTYYKQILVSKRIDSADMRIKSGWWGDHKNAYSAGKIKPTVLREILLSKSADWYERNGTSKDEFQANIAPYFDGCGIYVIKHNDHQCFQLVQRANKVFPHVMEKFKQAFDGNNNEPLAALLIVTMYHEWDFYFIPVAEKGGDQMLKIKENDAILKHDSLWPYGLNFFVHNDSYAELVEFRKSCIRHKWPPSTDLTSLEQYDMDKLMSVEIPKACTNKAKSPTTEEAKDVSDGKPAKSKPAASGKATVSKTDTVDNGQQSTDTSPIERTSSESSIVSTGDAPATTPKTTTPRSATKTPRSATENRPKSTTSKLRPLSGSGRGRGERKIPTPSPGRK